MSKNKKIILAVILIIIVAIILIIAIGGRRNERKSFAQNMEDMLITSPLEKRSLTSSISVTGTIASADTRTVTSGLNDIEITAVHVSVGDYVNAGDVICEFDASTIEDELEEAQSAYNLQTKKSTKNLDDAKDSITQAEENYNEGVAENNSTIAGAKDAYDNAVSKQNDAKEAYEAADDTVKKAKKEYEKVKDKKSSLKKKMEEAKKAYDAAKAEYDKASIVTDVDLTSEIYDTYQKAEAEYNQAKNAYDAVEQKKKSYDDAKTAKTEAKKAYDDATVEVESTYAKYLEAQNDATDKNEKNAAEIENKKEEYSITSIETTNNLENQKNQVDQVADKLDDCAVTAPISGVVTSVLVEVGDIYKGEEIVVIQDSENFVVDATVDEYDISDIAKGMKAVIKTDATDDVELEGEVTFVAPTPNSAQGNAGNVSNTSNYSIQITLKDKNERLRVGMTAKTSIILESKEDVFAVAYDSITTDSTGNSYITVLDNGERPNRSDRTGKTNNTDNASAENVSTEKASATNASSENTSSEISQNRTRQIKVEIGMESDYYVEIISDELTEGMQVVTTISNAVNATTESDSSEDRNFMMPGGGMGGFDGGGSRGGQSGGRGGMPAGGPGGF